MLNRRHAVAPIAVFVAAFAALTTPAAVFAQSYPAKPIRWVVPYPAGGGSDFLARTISQQLAGFADAQAIDELDEIAPRGLLEYTTEISRRHAQMVGDFFQRNIPGVVAEDVIDRPVGAIDVVLIGELRGGGAGQQLEIIAGYGFKKTHER